MDMVALMQPLDFMPIIISYLKPTNHQLVNVHPDTYLLNKDRNNFILNILLL